MSISINGIEALTKKLESLKDVERMEKNMKKACALVERAAKKKAVKESGELRQSITSKVEIDDGKVIGVVFTPLYYAPYVEYGTGLFAEGGNGRKEVPWVYVEGNTSAEAAKSKKVYTEAEANQTAAFLREQGLDAHVSSGQHPHPFMRPALDENRTKIKEILKKGITEND